MSNPFKAEPNFAGIKLRNPLVLLSGTAGYGKELSEIIDLSRLGGLICKTITLLPREGNPPPRTAETASGLVNSIGLENPGLKAFIKNVVPYAKNLPLPVLASIAGNKRELARMAKELEETPLAGLELNLSCPNLSGGALNPVSPAGLHERIKTVRRSVKMPVLAKLPPDLFRIEILVKAAEEAGSDGLTIANTFPAIVFDVRKRKPVLGGVTGGLSGPAILPLSLYLVFRARQATRLPILGSGGVFDGPGAVSMLLAGANAVGLGTVNFFQPDAYKKILTAIKKYVGCCHPER
ncbi:MAG: dihydroorotate dehydrogenase [Candidatus Omnitrophota bacterium]